MKVCKVCGEEKPLSEFVKNKNCKGGHENQCKSCLKEYHKKYGKKYREENAEKINEYKKNKYKNDPLFRLKCNVRVNVKRAIKNKRTEEIIGCSFAELKLHLENQFTEGMSWDNYGQWHIDHKKPLSWFDLTNPEEVAKANHYSNLQPLWAEDNLIKGNRFAS